MLSFQLYSIIAIIGDFCLPKPLTEEDSLWITELKLWGCSFFCLFSTNIVLTSVFIPSCWIPEMLSLTGMKDSLILMDGWVDRWADRCIGLMKDWFRIKSVNPPEVSIFAFGNLRGLAHVWSFPQIRPRESSTWRVQCPCQNGDTHIEAHGQKCSMNTSVYLTRQFSYIGDPYVHQVALLEKL